MGALISGPLMDKFGRKGVNMVIATLCIPSWFMTGFVNLEYPMLLYGTRISIGLAAGKSSGFGIYFVSICSGYKRSISMPFFLQI